MAVRCSVRKSVLANEACARIRDAAHIVRVSYPIAKERVKGLATRRGSDASASATLCQPNLVSIGLDKLRQPSCSSWSCLLTEALATKGTKVHEGKDRAETRSTPSCYASDAAAGDNFGNSACKAPTGGSRTVPYCFPFVVLRVLRGSALSSDGS